MHKNVAFFTTTYSGGGRLALRGSRVAELTARSLRRLRLSDLSAERTFARCN